MNSPATATASSRTAVSSIFPTPPSFLQSPTHPQKAYVPSLLSLLQVIYLGSQNLASSKLHTVNVSTQHFSDAPYIATQESA